jgi:hypothetical protein
MSETRNWHDENTRYLATAVGWVRARLEQRGGGRREITTTMLDAETKKESRSLWRQLSRRSAAVTPKPDVILLPHENASAWDGAGSEPKSAEGSAATPPPALETLCRRLDLTRFERDVLLLCVSMELDTSIAPLCARAQGDPAKPYPTFALALSLFDDPTWDALSQDWFSTDVQDRASSPYAGGGF